MRVGARHRVGGALLAALLVGPWAPVVPPAVAQASLLSPVPVREIRTVPGDELDVPRPGGIAYDPAADVLLVAGPMPDATALARVDRDETLLGTAVLPAGDPATLAFDRDGGQLMVLDGGDLVTVADEELDESEPDADRRPLRGAVPAQPAGAAIAADGSVLVLDGAGGALVEIAADGTSRRIPLTDLTGRRLAGLARDPADGQLHVGSPDEQRVYALADDGTVTATYDYAGTGVAELQALAFAPSSDTTDDPGTQHLFVADAGDETTLGGVTELDLAPTAVAAVAAETAVFVQEIATSSFTPASPDPSGVTWIPSVDELLVVDSEVDEQTGAGHRTTNLWQLDRLGTVTRSGDVLDHSREPTGADYDATGDRLFVTADDTNRVDVFGRGPDGEFGTGDDTVESIDTEALGLTDTEDPAFDPVTGDLFFLDGVSAELWRVDPGNGVFGDGDDQASHVDVGQHGIADAEALAYDPDRDTFVVGDRSSTTMYEITRDGSLVTTIDISAATSLNQVSGLAIAPTSSDPGQLSLWIVDRATDNGFDPDENDGMLFELARDTVPTPPTVTITTPEDGANLVDGEPATFAASADDIEDGNLTASLTWTSDVDGALGTGGSVTVTLSSGFHRVTAAVTDSDGMTGEATVTVNVTGPNGPFLVEREVATDDDDAEESVATGEVQTGSSDLELVDEGTNRQQVGVRFLDVDVPAGATVTEAWLQFQVDEPGTNATDLTIRAQDAADPGTFVETTGDVSGRPTTTASVGWQPPGWPTVGERGPDQRTPDLSGVVAEVVRRPDWAAGNAMVFVVTGSGRRTAEAANSGVGRPMLHVAYTTGAPADDTAPTVVTNTGLTVAEGGAAVVATGDLQTTDDVSGPAGVTYTVDVTPENGQVTVDGSPLGQGGVFTQADVDAGLVAYTHDGSDTIADGFDFTVADEAGNATAGSFAITVTAVDDTAPTVIVNTGVTVAEGGTATITSTELAATDDVSDAAGVVFTLDTVPANGNLTRNAVLLGAGDSFTQANIDAGLIVYSHDGSDTTADGFDFTVADEAGNSAADSFAIAVTAVDDTAPTVTASSGMTVAEGGAAVITSAQLAATDDVSAPVGVTFTIDVAPTSGQLELDGVALGAGDSFTQADVDAGLVAYAHDGSDTTSDSFGFTVADEAGNTTIGSFAITVTAVDDTAPTVTVNTGVTVSEGESATLTSAELAATDDVSDAAGVTFTLDTVPANGQLTRNAVLLGAGDTFTQANIDAGLVVYTHDGTDTTSDGFDFTVADQAGNATTGSFAMTVTAVDDTAPTVTTNTGLTVAEGGASTITSAVLTATDDVSTASGVTYTLDTAPANGALALDGTPLAATDTFTQANIDAGLVAYTHDGSDTTSDGFDFTVRDEAGNATTGRFAITVTAVDDIGPTVTANAGLTVAEGGTATITSAALAATDDVSDAAGVTFTLDAAPVNGQLTRNSVLMGAGDSFTQANIEAGLVVYAHDGSDTTSDGFDFIVADEAGNTTTGSFAITVTAVDDSAPTVTSNAGVTVVEGGTATISSAELAATDDQSGTTGVTFTLDTVPVNGQVTVNGAAAGSFTQADVDAGRVVYTHDGSDTASDGFDFSVADEAGNTTTGTFAITITPVDDTAPTITANTGLTVAEGSSTTITVVELAATDDVSVAAGIAFTVDVAPVNGQVTVDGSALGVGGTFTQADLESGLVAYVHDGSDTTTDGFGFTVADEAGNTTAGTFAIAITPVDEVAPTVTANAGVALEAGETVAITSAELAAVDDVSGPAGVTYTLDVAPAHGSLVVDGAALTTGSTFTQADIDAGLLVYVNDGSQASDGFVATITDEAGNATGVTFWMRERWSDPHDPCPWQASYFANTTLSGAPAVTRCDDAIDFDWGTGSPAPAVPVNDFSARWVGTLDLEAGTTTFTATADDGIRLWLDGELLIDGWKNQSATTYTATAAVDTGEHTVRVEYYEAGGGAQVRVSWSSCSSDAWTGEYYSNRSLSGVPSLVRCDPAVDFDWGSGSPDAVVGDNNFSVRWLRSTEFAAGTYTFTTVADDGIRVWVDGVLLIDGWRDRGRRTRTATTALSGGLHHIRVEYHEISGDALARVSWAAA